MTLHQTDLGTSSATLSACGRYRYALERATGATGPNLVWLMLNPSTADATKDDPTIRKVIGFSRRGGYGVAMVVDLFALRSTDPSNVRKNLADAEGPENRLAITQAVSLSDALVCAWGPKPWARPQAAKVLGWLDAHPAGRPRMLCVGTAKDGSPFHPLMQPYATGLVAFVPRAGRR